MIAHPGKLKDDAYFQVYIDCVTQDDALDALYYSKRQTIQIFSEIPENKEDYKYAVGKWTVKQMLQHIIDAEKVFHYRALRLARKDNTAMAGYHENPYAMNDNTHNLELSSIIEEFKLVRDSSLHFFEYLNEDSYDFEGVASNNIVSPRILAWIIAGHNLHHLSVLNEKYIVF